MADDRCPQCGALLAMVGRVHNCRPNPLIVSSKPKPVLWTEDADPTNWDPKRDEAGSHDFGPKKAPKVKPVKERDKPKFDRNAYQRDYMRKYRKKKKGDGSGK